MNRITRKLCRNEVLRRHKIKFYTFFLEMATNKLMILIIFSIIGNINGYSQLSTNIPKFSNLNEIKSYASSSRAIRAFSDHDLAEDVAALFYKDPALFVFKGDELDKSLYLKSQKYIDDKQYWANLKKRPLCLQVDLKFKHPSGVSDAIKDFTTTGYSLKIASAVKHKVSKTLHQRFMKLGGIYFPTTQSSRKDLVDNEMGGQYTFKVNCNDTDALLSLRTKVNNNSSSNDVFKLVILYTPICEKEFKITTGPVYIQHTYRYYFGKVLKAYLVYNNDIIDDLTGLFNKIQPSVIDSTILPAEKNYILNKYKR